MIKVTDGVCTIKPESTFTIYDVEQFVHSVREKLPSITAVQLDFAAVNEFDTAGFQTVYALYKSLQEQKVAMSFVASSNAIERIVNLFGVDEWYQTLLKEGGAHATH
jgi:anti-anti-sigma regulatory factor